MGSPRLSKSNRIDFDLCRSHGILRAPYIYGQGLLTPELAGAGGPERRDGRLILKVGQRGNSSSMEKERNEKCESGDE